MASDRELLERIRAGGREALAELYARHLSALWRFAAAQLPAEDARDAVSETFLAAVRQWPKMDGMQGDVAAWLTGVARHKIADIRRRRRHDPLIEAAAPADAGTLAQDETHALVGRIMLSLPDDERLALEWKYLEGLSVRDIATRLGRTEKAVESLLFRARASFREKTRALPDMTEH